MKHIRIPRNIGTAWLDALRSGKYPQATGRLSALVEENDSQRATCTTGYCCLGVLQVVVSGDVEREGKYSSNVGEPMGYPTAEWLAERGIEFYDRSNYPMVSEDSDFDRDDDCENEELAPYLPAFGYNAAEANDGMIDHAASKYGTKVWVRPPKTFAEIADALEAEMEFTDAAEPIPTVGDTAASQWATGPRTS